jgi:hypothetical protein
LTLFDLNEGEIRRSKAKVLLSQVMKKRLRGVNSWAKIYSTRSRIFIEEEGFFQPLLQILNDQQIGRL